MSDKLKLVNSGGGPLIVVSVEIAHHWRGDGGLGLPNGDLSMVWETVRKQTDYGRACGIADYLGVLEVGPGECLVLGDEPMLTTILPTNGGVLIVRWMYAESEEEVLRSVRFVPEDAWEATPHQVNVGSGALILFDSAYPGDDLPTTCADGANVPWMKVAVPMGIYEVHTADYQPNDSTRLILHRMQALPISTAVRMLRRSQHRPGSKSGSALPSCEVRTAPEPPSGACGGDSPRGGGGMHAF